LDKYRELAGMSRNNLQILGKVWQNKYI